MTLYEKDRIEKIIVSLQDVLRNFDHPPSKETCKNILAACIEELEMISDQNCQEVK